MPFVKLDCDILDSSLWDWTPERHIFITALLMARPHELKQPTPQLEADSLTPTGWIVPAGKYGLVTASGVMIIKKALAMSHAERLEGGEDFQEALAALGALGSPDEDSRSQAFDGRRLVRIDGGYIVLNYQRFRDKDHTVAERKRRQREREREEESRRDVTVSHDVSHPVTQAEAEAEAEKKHKKRKTKILTTIPEDFEITPPMREWFTAHCPLINIEIETAKFKERCLAKGTEYKDWVAGWRTQMMNAQGWAQERTPAVATAPNRPTAREMHAKIDAEEALLREKYNDSSQ